MHFKLRFIMKDRCRQSTYEKDICSEKASSQYSKGIDGYERRISPYFLCEGVFVHEFEGNFFLSFFFDNMRTKKRISECPILDTPVCLNGLYS